MESKIIGIISEIVCTACGQAETAICAQHRDRCFALYHAQAKRIHNEIVAPKDAFIEAQQKTLESLTAKRNGRSKAP